MRIISGKFKGRELKTPKGGKTRPTSGKVRGSVFDILQAQVEGTDFLDLFAGSGAMGIEALSRGARHATFVEKDRIAVRALRDNLICLKLEEETTLLSTDVFAAVKRFVKAEASFQVIYIDPPYALDISPLFPQLSSILADGGILIIEQGKKGEIAIEGLEQIQQRSFGDTILHFFQQPSG